MALRTLPLTLVHGQDKQTYRLLLPDGSLKFEELIKLAEERIKPGEGKAVVGFEYKAENEKAAAPMAPSTPAKPSTVAQSFSGASGSPPNFGLEAALAAAKQNNSTSEVFDQTSLAQLEKAARAAQDEDKTLEVECLVKADGVKPAEGEITMLGEKGKTAVK
ncbi:hypothetical protein JCM10207_000026 [Rhodosporidiobolus poonsookiae]